MLSGMVALRINTVYIKIYDENSKVLLLIVHVMYTICVSHAVFYTLNVLFKIKILSSHQLAGPLIAPSRYNRK